MVINGINIIPAPNKYSISNELSLRAVITSSEMIKETTNGPITNPILESVDNIPIPIPLILVGSISALYTSKYPKTDAMK